LDRRTVAKSGASMKLRQFLRIAGGAAAAWPLLARSSRPSGQSSACWPTSTAAAWRPWIPAFVQRLGELGWIEGRTVAIEARWAEGKTERFADIAAELARLNVDVIVTSGAAAPAAKHATSALTLPATISTSANGVVTIQSLFLPPASSRATEVFLSSDNRRAAARTRAHDHEVKSVTHACHPSSSPFRGSRSENPESQDRVQSCASPRSDGLLLRQTSAFAPDLARPASRNDFSSKNSHFTCHKILKTVRLGLSKESRR
jgi:hypothetical protein